MTTYYKIIKKMLKTNNKLELLYKRDIFNKTIVVKYLYSNEKAKLNHIQEMKKEDWFIINEETIKIKNYDKEEEYPTAEFMQEYTPIKKI